MLSSSRPAALALTSAAVVLPLLAIAPAAADVPVVGRQPTLLTDASFSPDGTQLLGNDEGMFTRRALATNDVVGTAPGPGPYDVVGDSTTVALVRPSAQPSSQLVLLDESSETDLSSRFPAGTVFRDVAYLPYGPTALDVLLVETDSAVEGVSQLWFTPLVDGVTPSGLTPLLMLTGTPTLLDQYDTPDGPQPERAMSTDGTRLLVKTGPIGTAGDLDDIELQGFTRNTWSDVVDYRRIPTSDDVVVTTDAGPGLVGMSRRTMGSAQERPFQPDGTTATYASVDLANLQMAGPRALVVAAQPVQQSAVGTAVVQLLRVDPAASGPDSGTLLDEVLTLAPGPGGSLRLLDVTSGDARWARSACSVDPWVDCGPVEVVRLPQAGTTTEQPQPTGNVAAGRLTSAGTVLGDYQSDIVVMPQTGSVFTAAGQDMRIAAFARDLSFAIGLTPQGDLYKIDPLIEYEQLVAEAPCLAGVVPADASLVLSSTNGHVRWTEPPGDGCAPTAWAPIPTAPYAPTRPGEPTLSPQGAGGLRVTWPASRGTVTQYTATLTGGKTCTVTSPDDGATQSCLVTGLTVGEFYTATVTAQNSAGTSRVSRPSFPFPAVSTPGPVRGVTRAVRQFEVGVSWKPPLADGGAVVESYQVDTRRLGATAWRKVETVPNVPPLSTFVDGDRPGVTLEVRLRARNAAGVGTSVVVAVRAGLPEAPRRLLAGGTRRSISLSWQAAPSANASVVTAYRVQRSKDARTWRTIANLGAAARSYRDGDLAPGTTFAYRVRAVNAVGAGAPSRACEATATRFGTAAPTRCVSP